MIWFISDTHYGHKNIVQGTSNWTDKSGCRPFRTVKEHDDWLVNMINKDVQPSDTLFHLGDWSFGGKDNIRKFRDRIICQDIILIPGNHDHHQKDVRDITDSVWGLTLYPDYFEFARHGIQLVLCHYPIDSWNNMERGARHLHGHVHGQGVKKCGRLDVGVDALGLISLDKIAQTPLATEQRHSSIEGGNKFA